MQYMCRFNLQIFTAVQCGCPMSHGRCPVCKRFCPKSYESCLLQWLHWFCYLCL